MSKTTSTKKDQKQKAGSPRPKKAEDSQVDPTMNLLIDFKSQEDGTTILFDSGSLPQFYLALQKFHNRAMKAGVYEEMVNDTWTTIVERPKRSDYTYLMNSIKKAEIQDVNYDEYEELKQRLEDLQDAHIIIQAVRRHSPRGLADAGIQLGTYISRIGMKIASLRNRSLEDQGEFQSSMSSADWMASPRLTKTPLQNRRETMFHNLRNTQHKDARRSSTTTNPWVDRSQFQTPERKEAEDQIDSFLRSLGQGDTKEEGELRESKSPTEVPPMQDQVGVKLLLPEFTSIDDLERLESILIQAWTVNQNDPLYIDNLIERKKDKLRSVQRIIDQNLQEYIYIS